MFHCDKKVWGGKILWTLTALSGELMSAASIKEHPSLGTSLSKEGSTCFSDLGAGTKMEPLYAVTSLRQGLHAEISETSDTLKVEMRQVRTALGKGCNTCICDTTTPTEIDIVKQWAPLSYRP